LADLGATGGNPPYKWSLTAGSLPPGLTLHRGTGVISGKSTTAGTYSFTVQAVDKRTRRTRTTPTSQCTATVILSIQIF
jgi:large repetitive protein